MHIDIEHKTWDMIPCYVAFTSNTAVQKTAGFASVCRIPGREATMTPDAILPHLLGYYNDDDEDAAVISQ